MDIKEKIVLADNEHCTGCMACYSVCPTKAIKKESDDRGFLYPKIEHERCIGCNSCSNVCPELNAVIRGEKNPECYAAQAEDKIRIISSSGGIFSVLASEVIKNGGVVFGATIDMNLNVKHIYIEKIEDLQLLRGSKYVQSDVGDTYKRVKEFLKEDKLVLYIGCPCQIAGLRSYINQEYSNLLTIDLLCSGVPSNQDFIEDISTKISLDKIKSIKFRDKNHGQGWRCDSLYVNTFDGGGHSFSVDSSSFLQCFQNKISFRESCYNCQYFTRDRVGDISLGDFWGIENYDVSLNDNNGISLVLINTEKGKKMFDKIKNKLPILEKVDPEYSPHNTIHGFKREKPLEQSRFLELFKKYGYNKAATYSGYKRYDIGIVGCWSVENHGSNLSYYALYQFLKDCGFETLMIERPLSSKWKPNKTPIWFNKSPYKPWDLAPIFDNLSSMRKLNQQCDIFIVGSDQLFYHELYDSFNEFIDLSYIDSYKKKIAYAASVGRNHFDGTEYQRAKLSHFLQEFDEISVRESDAVELFDDTFNVDATQVLDPVFLCDIKHYHKLAEQGVQSHKTPHIFAYILDPSGEKAKILHQLSQDLGMPVKVFGDVAKQDITSLDWDFQMELSVSNETWVRAFIDADLVVTDSFHGTCFAILFEKQFISVINQYRGKSRFISLLSQFGLEKRMINSLAEYQQLNHEEIVYSDIVLAIDKKICESKQWLLSAINGRKISPLSTYDLLDNRLSLTENDLKFVKNKTYSSETWLSNTHQRVDALEEQMGVKENHLHFIQQAVEEIQVDIEEKNNQQQMVSSQLQKAIEEIQVDREERNNQHQMIFLQLQQDIDNIRIERDKQIIAYDKSLCELQKEVKLLRVETESKISYMENVLAELQEEMEQFKQTIWYRIYKKTRGGKS